MRVFIGSSSEQRRLVEWLTSFIRAEYSGKIIPVPWTTPWIGGRFTLKNLLRFVDETDACILFWTADDKTWYRDTQRHEPRDNLVFEAGLFIAAHGRERTQLMIPRYEPGDKRADVVVPSDVSGMTWNQYQWADGPPDATGLPITARTVCDNLLTLGARLRRPSLLRSLSGRDNVEEIKTFVGNWGTIHADGIARLAGSASARAIDLLAAYRVGEVRRVIDDFKQRDDAKLRACFANMWDEELLRIYQRKYFDRDSDYIKNAVKESIQGLLGPCKIETSSPNAIRVTGVEKPPKAQYEIRLTNQRITYGYYRIDGVAFIVPLDMKRVQNPAPLVWVLDQETAPQAFQYYVNDYERMFEEAIHVFP